MQSFRVKLDDLVPRCHTPPPPSPASPSTSTSGGAIHIRPGKLRFSVPGAAAGVSSSQGKAAASTSSCNARQRRVSSAAARAWTRSATDPGAPPSPCTSTALALCPAVVALTWTRWQICVAAARARTWPAQIRRFSSLLRCGGRPSPAVAAPTRQRICVEAAGSVDLSTRLYWTLASGSVGHWAHRAIFLIHKLFTEVGVVPCSPRLID
ncbi:hypothetical protein PVAP13_9KG338857 [Panicum virgatum]|uniref:Uncharacterized protein n=1 Tax=Panicum virgatum TaxID=38727 RepID=A0A8T0NMF9_PANVG|nr:hypothetical protein PVAP13_9KG338857 [Panicum virgatum]